MTMVSSAKDFMEIPGLTHCAIQRLQFNCFRHIGSRAKRLFKGRQSPDTQGRGIGGGEVGEP